MGFEDREPQSANEGYLRQIAIEEESPFDREPQSPIEGYLRYIATQEENPFADREPQSANEYWLKQIADNGGGGGSSDFSTAQVTFTVVNTNGNVAIGIGIVNDTLAYLDGISVQDNDTISYVLYKGSQEVEAVDVAEITVSGNATILDQSEDDGVWRAIIEIIGDCIIHLTGTSDI